ncbi:unnamed protein product [Trypanosoma congolense IL3000]|uniref:WGS project CAEQ00000000 data, annotated contig 1943 n=1 Tax=Trypanosoma congolense (strain IL3000) TaxID=1068625 RepID=F9WA67_TRYCI|nr:unnamed protein product [Trypanosoma congolense IL3000]
MERDVVEMLLEGIIPPNRINFYLFLRPVCPVVQGRFARFTLGEFVRNPRHCIPEANVCDAIWQYLPYLLWKFRQSATPLVRHFGPTRTWEKWHWDSWKIYYDMDDMPLEAIDEEIWRRCRRPPVVQYGSYQGVVLVGGTASFIQVPYTTVGYLVSIPLSPQPWPGL